MLSESTRRRIKERKMHKHSNPSQLLKRVKDQSTQAIKDLTLIAGNLEEEQLKEIFTDTKLAPLFRAIQKPSNKRVFEITELFANFAFQKLALELPNDMVNSMSGDIGKTWTFAKLLSEFADKPLTKQRIKSKKIILKLR